MKKAYLCIDAGGLSVKYSIYNEKRDELLSDAIKYNLPDTNEIFNYMKIFYNSICDKFEILGVGIAMSGIIDSNNKQRYSLNNDKLSKTSLMELMDWCKVPWSIENDANCSLLAEMNYGNAVNYKNILLFTIGTALGGAIAINGEIYKGSNMMANEIGCGLLDYSQPFKNISVNTGMNGLRDHYNLNNPNNLKSIEEIVESGQKGEINSLNSIKFFQKNIAKVILNTNYVIDPEIILIGGGISKNLWYLNGIKDELFKLAKLTGVKVFAEVKNCKFFNESGKLGAFSMISKGE